MKNEKFPKELYIIAYKDGGKYYNEIVWEKYLCEQTNKEQIGIYELRGIKTVKKTVALE